MNENTRKRVQNDPVDSQPFKRGRNNSESVESSEDRITGWQAALGTSLAERLENLTEQRNLTARQVKKLLRAVLTNEDVVSAFRRYIHLSEPETGEPSATTKRHVSDLGLFLASATDNQPGSQALEPRVITRSLSRTIQHSLRGYLPSTASGDPREPCTILDMEFSEDEDAATENNSSGMIEGTSGVAKERDEDYCPGPADFYIFQRDRILDSARSHQCATNNPSEANSQCVIQTDDTSRHSTSSEDSCSLSAVSEPPTDLAGWLEDGSHSSDNCYQTRLRSAHTHPLPTCAGRTPTGSDVGEHLSVNFVGDNDQVASREQSSTSLGKLSSRTVHGATDDDVYAEFLRSLFGSPQATPTKNRNCGDAPSSSASPKGSHVDAIVASHIGTELNVTNNTEDDDPDDPEFDVMAELDLVDREDFFDELRDDRAVRVSKMEAKTLHQDLRELFSDEENDPRLPFGNHKSRTLNVLSMKSQCHRFLQAKRLFKHHDGTDPSSTADREPNDTQTHGSNDDALVESGFNWSQSAESIYFRKSRLTSAQQTQLQRQLGMHVQLLTTNFLLTYDFPHLHSSVTRACASALKQLASRRDAFDLLAQQRVSSVDQIPRSFYWSCTTLDDAIRLITDYAGLSFLPLFPKQSARHHSTTLAENGRSCTPKIPLPMCLIRLMLSNPIWSYACLMPTNMPSLPVSDNASMGRRRFGFLPSEDALTLLGLSDFLRSQTESLSESTQSRYLTYRLIRKYLLPHRNLLQIRARRWNLLCTRKTQLPDTVPLATRRLFQLYSNVSNNNPVDVKQLRDFADEVAPKSVPRNVPYRCGSLCELAADELFETHGLPRFAGYETVLSKVTEERPCRGEFSKLVHDTLIDFSQLAICMWWSGNARHCLDTSPASWEGVLKPEDTSNANARDLGILGPNYLPAIPVDLAPDGSVILNTKAEPTLVEWDSFDSQPPGIRTFRPDVFARGPIIHTHTPEMAKPQDDSVSAHIEELLDRIRQHATPTDVSDRRCTFAGFHSSTLDHLSSKPRVSDKLPIPKLADIHASRNSFSGDYRSKVKKQALRLSRCASARSTFEQPNQSSFHQPATSPGLRDKRRSSVQFQLSTLEQLSSTPRVTGKLPLPRLPDSQSNRNLFYKDYRSRLKKQALRLSRSFSARGFSESQDDVATAEFEQHDSHVSSPIDDGLEFCQLSSFQPATSPGLRGKRRSSVQFQLSTLEQLSSPPRVTGKLPLPRLPDSQSNRNLFYKDYRYRLKKQALRLSRSFSARGFSESQDDVDTAEFEQHDSHVSSPIDDGLEFCQQSADTLISQFHLGLDNLLAAMGDTVFGPLRFHPLAVQSNPHCKPTLHHSSIQSLDFFTGSHQLASVFPSSCYNAPARFLNRCKARGEASTVDFLSLPTSLQTEAQSSLDESDVHRTRSLLDRCRAYLSPADYSVIVFTLRQLNQIVYNEQTVCANPTYEQDVLAALAVILQHLQSHKCLWEDFVTLLTPEQARRLGILPTYLNLTRVARVQRVLQSIIPREKRFWQRLRNLADSYFLSTRNSMRTDSSDTRVASKSAATSLYNRRLATSKHFGLPHRLKGLRTKYVRFPISKTWRMFESTWKNRPVLFSQLAALLNDTHKPYSEFEQSFDEIDLLARRPLGVMSSESVEVDGVKPIDHFLNEEEASWEVCTSLSAAAARDRLSGRNSAPSLTHQGCPCPCHSATTTSQPSSLLTAGKSAKAVTGLAARHCMSCSLTVHQGVVYLDNRNFRLRDVQITWPEGFKPKSALRPSNRGCVTFPRSPRDSIQCSTRTALRKLAESHASIFYPSQYNATSNKRLPDMARRRVSIEFVSGRASRCHSRLQPITPKTKTTSTPSDTSSVRSTSNCVPVFQNPRLSYVSIAPSSYLVDDEAACFNTEAFAPRESQSSHTSSENDYWHPEEDRQLLEFSKSQGRYRSSMFIDLAESWVPKPSADSKRRNALELEMRFKQLMRLTLGEDYDPELFSTPRPQDEDKD